MSYIDENINQGITLKIGTSSLPGVYPRFNGTKVIDGKYFGVSSTATSENDQTNIIVKDGVRKAISGAFSWVVLNSVQVWVLPELCLDQDDLMYLMDLVRRHGNALQVIVAGTTYITESARLPYHNRATVYIKSGSEWITKFYDKRFPFVMNINKGSTSYDTRTISEIAERYHVTMLAEDFAPGTDVCINTVNGIKFGIAICRDVLDVFDDKNPLRTYCNNVKLMLVTSMNAGHTDLFTASAESMARWHDCTTIYVNNFTSVPEPQNNTVEMSFALLPSSSSPAGVKGRIYYRRPPAAGSIQSDEYQPCHDLSFEERVGSIYSGGVKAYPIDATGNVLYAIVDGEIKN